MKNILIISYSGFSDVDANGKTLKNLLHGWDTDHIMQFYCGDQTPDFSCCSRYFHVTDKQMIKAFWGKKEKNYYINSDIAKISSIKNKEDKLEKNKSNNFLGRIMFFLKKHNYNFFLRYGREYLWMISPWDKKKFFEKVRSFCPDVIFYMVGESLFLDRLVVKLVKELNIPLVLYNAEAYRLVDVKERRGIERRFYNKIESSYTNLNNLAKLIIYNCEYLLENYQKKYNKNNTSIIAYNSDKIIATEYKNRGKAKKIVYFGNLGVGRVDSLLDISHALKKIDHNLKIDVYGRTTSENIGKFRQLGNINYHGFVDQNTLLKVKNEADILLQVESFNPEIMPKLKFAFSTKIAQYLCAGRCVVSYAPLDMASSQYLIGHDAAISITEKEKLCSTLYDVINDENQREEMALRALKIAKSNHDIINTSEMVRENILNILNIV